MIVQLTTQEKTSPRQTRAPTFASEALDGTYRVVRLIKTLKTAANRVVPVELVHSDDTSAEPFFALICTPETGKKPTIEKGAWLNLTLVTFGEYKVFTAE